MAVIMSALLGMFMGDFGVPGNKLGRDSKLNDLLGNKFDIQVIKERLEHHFGIKIPDEKVEEFVALGDIEDYLLERNDEIR